jgi:lysophospholipase L1-like esterase
MSRVTRARSRFLLIGVLALTAAGLVGEARLQGQGLPAGQHWVGTWATALMARVPAGERPAPGHLAQPADVPTNATVAQPLQSSALQFSNQTLRQIVRVSLGGEQIRVVFSNRYGTAPLAIGAAHVALRDKESSIVAGSARPLTFAGQPTASISGGAMLVSDPVKLAVPALADLVIDLYLPGDTAASKSPVTLHPAAWQTNYVSQAGNHAGAANFPMQATTAFNRNGMPSATWFYLARVEVLAPVQAGAVVAFGDSITDGTASGLDANSRWPDHLAKRLAREKLPMAVLNLGIGGNRVLDEGAGPSALSRIDRDVLAQPGITHVIFLEGINDIGGARDKASPSAADVIAGHRQVIELARARGLKVIGATLTPFEGANYYTAAGEAKRQALNEWIRTSKMYDGVIDFDAALRDPSRPTRTLPQYDPGDHLHATGDGYRVMAEAIDLALFKAGVRAAVPSSK